MESPTTSTTAPAQEGPQQTFVEAVLSLDRGNRAVLKRNAGNTLAEARGCYWFYRLLPPPFRDEIRAEACFLVATLMCSVRAPERGRGPTRSFGAAMQELSRKAQGSSEAVARRFGLLLDARFEPRVEGGGELAFRLRQLVRLADSRDVAIPWVSLLCDLPWWSDPRKSVQKRWAQHFYTVSSE